MNPIDRRLDGLVVVDASIEDYAALVNDERLQGLPYRHFTAGEEALQRLDASRATLWMVAMRLPDMTGVNFLHLVRHRVRRSPVFLIGDAYSADDELAARSAGATAYLCKPVNSAWLRLCHNVVSRAALRRGAPQSLP